MNEYTDTINFMNEWSSFNFIFLNECSFNFIFLKFNFKKNI